MSKQLHGKPLILHKIDFELRYHFGFTYLDRCGRTVNSIMRSYPDWIIRGNEPNPQNAPLVNIKNGCVFNFSTRSLDLHLEKPAEGEGLDGDKVEEFAAEVEQLTAIVLDQLELSEFSRIGCRVWYLFPCETQPDAEKWLLSLELYQPSTELLKAFAGESESTSFATVIASDDRKFRIEFETVERAIALELGDGILNLIPHRLHTNQKKALIEREKARKLKAQNPQFGARINIDASQADPEIIKPGEFVRSSANRALKCLEASMQRRV